MKSANPTRCDGQTFQGASRVKPLGGAIFKHDCELRCTLKSLAQSFEDMVSLATRRAFRRVLTWQLNALPN